MRINYGKKEAEQKKSNCKIKTPEKKTQYTTDPITSEKTSDTNEKRKDRKNSIKNTD